MKRPSLALLAALGILIVGCSNEANNTSASQGENSSIGTNNTGTGPFVATGTGVAISTAVGTGTATGSGFTTGALSDPSVVNSATGSDAGTATSGVLTAGLWDDNANFDVFQSYLDNQLQTYAANLPHFDLAAMQAAHAATLQRQPASSIDIELMLDTTGSMSDELAYLQAEFLGISTAVSRMFPSVSVRWSLLVYRDTGDDYVTRAFDFTPDGSVFRLDLVQQSSAGGGDEPEAVASALSESLTLSWPTTGAKMLLWVADAPHHDADTASVASSLAQIRDRGIHIYPVAASSANPLAEATMRVAAQITGGRYLFLTDDSGIGNAHSEPKVPCYYVTKLADAIKISIATEITGGYVPPDAESIVRVVGTPNGPTCALDADAGN